MSARSKYPTFSDAELHELQRAARRVWNEIGGDVLQALGVGETSGGSISRDDVIEMVCDADRLEEQLRRSGQRVLAAKVAQHDTSIYQHVRGAFPHARYGW